MQADELAALAEKFDVADLARKEVAKKLAELEEVSKGLKARLMEAMQEAGTTATGYSAATFTIKEEIEPTVKNWSDFYDYVQSTGEFDLLFRRINTAAVKLRWEEDTQVPGVQKFPVYKLSRHGVK